jgi:hypothetical protein
LDGVDLGDGQWHQLDGRRTYAAKWCGIPWYFEDSHFKELHFTTNPGGLRFFTLYQRDIGNEIRYENSVTGARVGAQTIPENDFDCELSLTRDGNNLYIYIDITSQNYTNKYALWNQSGGYYEQAGRDEFARALAAAAGAG